MAGDLIRRGCGRDEELQSRVAEEELEDSGFTMILGIGGVDRKTVANMSAQALRCCAAAPAAAPVF